MIRRKVTTCYVEFLSKQQVDEGLPCKGFTAQKYGYIATILFVEPQIVFLKQRFLSVYWKVVQAANLWSRHMPTLVLEARKFVSGLQTYS